MDLEALMKETLEAKQALAAIASEPTRPPQPKKKEVLERFLALGITSVQVDTTLPGVDVPDHLMGSSVVLNFSYRFQIPHDVVLTDQELSQTLSFGGRSHRVRLPLRSIVAARCAATGEPAEFQVFTGEDYQDPEEDNDPPPPRTA
jgi:stringent starvation protein B